MPGGHYDWTSDETISLTLLQERIQNQVVAQVTSGTRPSTGGAPQIGELAFETDTLKLIGNVDGTVGGWVEALRLDGYETFTPTLGGFTISSTGYALWTRVGPFVHALWRGTIATVSGNMFVGLPVIAMSELRNQRQAGFGGFTATDASSSNEYTGILKPELAGTSTSFWAMHNDLGGDPSAAMGATTPWTWAAGDTIAFAILYAALPTSGPV